MRMKNGTTKKHAKAQASLLSEKEQRELRALDRTHAERPDVASKTLLHEARDLEMAARKDSAALVSGTDLAKNAVAELTRRAGLLERAQDQWDDDRQRRANSELKALRAAVEEKKRAAFAVLRYFCRHDAEVQARLDEIAEGSGDADLIDDGHRLAKLVKANEARLNKAKLGAKASEALETASRKLADAVAEQSGDDDAADSVDLRNRAFWYLRASMDEIRAAARYVFRDDPRKLAKYRSTITLARARRPAKPAKPEPAPAP